MKKSDNIIGWFTSKGSKIPIYEGETPIEAFHRFTAQKYVEAMSQQINYNKQQADVLNIKDEPVQVQANNIYRQTNDGTQEYGDAKEYIHKHGRGLGSAKVLTQEQERILSIIEDKAVPAYRDLTLYRTDDVEWLSKYNIGDEIPIKNILMTTLDPDYVVKENVGRVAQRMIINAPKRTSVFGPNNGAEMEVDIVRGHSIVITDRTRDKKGIPVYSVRINSI